MIVAIWLGGAAAISGFLRNVGPWWKIALGSLAWPALPFLAMGSYARFRIRRRRLA